MTQTVTNENVAPSPSGKTTISIDPVSRIEGHLKASVVVENGKVVDARLTGGMFRGFETILKGRDPRDASQIVQRICGVCPTAHATAASFAIDKTAGMKIPANSRITRNIILGSNFLQSHILHFYHLVALDYVKGPDTPPFINNYKNPDFRLPEDVNNLAVDQYLEALEVRRICHEMVALFGGRMPHVHAIVGGGATEMPTKEKLVEYAVRFKKVRSFIEDKHMQLVYAVGAQYADLFGFGQGFKNAICVGGFPLNDAETEFVFKPGVYIKGKDVPFKPELIREYVKYSWFDDATTNLPFKDGKTVVAANKANGYSFVKAPRYDGHAVEVGPAARMWIANPEISPVGKAALKGLLKKDVKNFRDIGEDIVFSAMGRHVARAEETYYMLQFITRWLAEVQVDKPTFSPPKIPVNGDGFGMTEAPRGSLIHYLKVKDSVVENYQIVSASLWNCSPKDDKENRGPLEQALIGTPVPDINNPVNVARIIRGFDP